MLNQATFDGPASSTCFYVHIHTDDEHDDTATMDPTPLNADASLPRNTFRIGYGKHGTLP